MKRIHPTRLGAALAVAAALILPSAGASAVDGNPALIDTTQPVSLTINKYLGGDSGTAGDGTEESVIGATPLSGVVFDVYRVSLAGEPINLTTNAGWEAASAITGYTLTAQNILDGAFTLGDQNYTITPVSEETTVSGATVFDTADGASIGLYLVNENLAKSTAITDGSTTIAASSITPAAPFFVTLPMTDPSTQASWMYDVNVYPKNQSDTITKAVSDSWTIAGSTGTSQITYTLTSTITDGTESLGTYVISDVLHPALTRESISIELVGGSTPVPLIADVDYTVQSAPPGPEGTEVTITMTGPGLKELEANRGYQVVTTLTATIGDLAADADGIVTNTATLIPNRDWATTYPNQALTSNEVRSQYGNLVVNKVDPAQGHVDMSGATFAVFKDVDTDGICSSIEINSGEVATGSVNNAGATGPTDPTFNQITFANLQVSDYYDGAEQSVDQGYCLVETKAPEGYNLDAESRYVPIEFSTGSATRAAFATIEVANEKANLGNSLPLTGGAGVAGLSGFALLLVGGGAAYYAVNRRREKRDGV